MDLDCADVTGLNMNYGRIFYCIGFRLLGRDVQFRVVGTSRAYY